MKFNIFFFSNNFYLKKKFFFFYGLFYKNFLLLDIFLMNFFFMKKKMNNLFLLKMKQLKNKNIFFMKNNVFKSKYSLSYQLLLMKFFFWLCSFCLCFIIFIYLSNISNISFNKIFFEWFLIIMFLYWLFSGFVFFMKKYQFSKYTSVIQRFWSSSFILFWLIESGIFLTFFYLTLNSSEEPVYMYDQMKLFKSHLFSWKIFCLKMLLNLYLVFLSYFLLLSLNFTNFKKQNLFILLMTFILLYFLWLEFYQFFHIMNFYYNLLWIFDYDEFIWNLEIEFSSTSMSNNYIALCLMAKFWHLIFIFMFWIFFVLSVNELSSASYPFFSANCQNFIMLYIMSWLFMYPWLKFYLSNIFDMNYFWFFNNTNKVSNRLFVNDLKLFYFSIVNSNFFFNNFKNEPFYYFFESSKQLLFSWKKHFLKNLLMYFNFS